MEILLDYHSKIPYDGGLGPAHLWFILYLFLISLVGLVIIRSFKRVGMEKILLKLKNKLIGKYSLFFMISIFFLADMTPLAIAQKNILLFLIVFLMGYIVYGDNDYLEYIDIKKGESLILTLILFIIYVFTILHYYNLNNVGNLGLKVLLSIIRNGIMITTIVAIVGYGRKYLNKGGKILVYLNKACFPVYILHQTVIVVIAYYLMDFEFPIYISTLIIIIGSVSITFGIYEVVKRIKIMRILIGIK